MKLTRQKDPSIDGSAVYVCIEGFATDIRGVARETRLRGSHPAVREQPLFWVEDGLDDAEISRIRQERGLSWLTETG